mgnify:CR=1 FL=1
MRLRRIRFKDGRAPIEILRTPQDSEFNGKPESLRGSLIRGAKKVVGYEKDDALLDGFIVIGLYSDGTRTVGFRKPQRIPREMFPSYIAEMLRTDAITENEAENVFDRRFEWRD